MQEQQRLYWGLLLLLFTLVIVAMGGGFFSQQLPWHRQWQHLAFMELCHQMPNRSFWLNGQPMAVCSRCFGIYSGFTLGWMMLPISYLAEYIQKVPEKKVAIIAVVINFLDILGNYIGLWENTLVSRFALGSLLGYSAACLFEGIAVKTIKQKGKNYGRVTTLSN